MECFGILSNVSSPEHINLPCVLDESEPVPLALPNQWLWDIIDEFIYQFQSFCHYRSRLVKMPEEDRKALKETQNKVGII